MALALTAAQFAGAGSATAASTPETSFAFSSEAYQVDEAAGPAEIEVVRTGSLEQAAYVHFETARGTASTGADYMSVSADVHFEPGEVSKTVQVPIVDDTLGEGDETVLLSLSKPSTGALAVPSSARLEIVDDDKAFAFYSDVFFTSEGDGSFIVAIRRLGVTTGTDRVDFLTANGTAVAGSDYTGVTATATFAPGETTKFLSAPIIDDRLIEPNETVRLALAGPSAGINVQFPSAATLTIFDNDKVSAPKKPSGRIFSARLTKTRFTSAQAFVVRLIYSFHPKSRVFVSVLSLRKGAGWTVVRRVKKTGSFAGRKAMKVNKLFGPKPILRGRYRLRLYADRNSKTLRFTIR